MSFTDEVKYKKVKLQKKNKGGTERNVQEKPTKRYFEPPENGHSAGDPAFLQGKLPGKVSVQDLNPLLAQDSSVPEQAPSTQGAT